MGNRAEYVSQRGGQRFDPAQLHHRRDNLRDLWILLRLTYRSFVGFLLNNSIFLASEATRACATISVKQKVAAGRTRDGRARLAKRKQFGDSTAGFWRD